MLAACERNRGGARNEPSLSLEAIKSHNASQAYRAWPGRPKLPPSMGRCRGGAKVSTTTYFVASCALERRGIVDVRNWRKALCLRSWKGVCVTRYVDENIY